MFLSGAWIEKNGKKLIFPFKEELIDCSTYTMRIGSEVYVSPDAKDGRDATLFQLGHEQEISVPPGQFAFLISREHLNIPIDLMAFINLRTKLKSQGLINVSGFHVDPGYNGRLIFSVFNAGVRTIKMRADDPVLLIWFARLENPDPKFSKQGKPGHTKISSDMMASLPSEGASIGSVSARLEKLEKELRAYKWIASIVVALLVSGLGSYPIWSSGAESTESVEDNR